MSGRLIRAGTRRITSYNVCYTKLLRSPPKLAGDMADVVASLEKVVTELKKSKGLSKGILDGLPTPYLLVDENEKTIASNKACMEMVEIDTPPEVQYGRTLAEIFYNDPVITSYSIHYTKLYEHVQGHGAYL